MKYYLMVRITNNDWKCLHTGTRDECTHKGMELDDTSGQGIGLSGKTYAIPTKDAQIRRTLPLSQIKGYVDDFIAFARLHPELTFLVTAIGCGLAELSPKEVAPLFRDAVNLPNVHLPSRFWHKILPNLSA